MQPIPREDLAALLQWYVDQGLDETIGEAPLDRFALPPPAPVAVAVAPADSAAPRLAPAAPVAPAASATAARPPPPPLPPRAPVPLESPQLVEDARALARRCSNVAELEEAIRAFEGCALKRTAKNTVFADGVAGAPVMVVGEAPGADEDRLGKPFVGVSGQLMDRMFEAIGMSRQRDLYITNIIFWRPPGNRTPTQAEQAICLAFTRRHIELAQPKVLVLAGGTSAKAILDTTEGIMRLRGKWTTVQLDDGSAVPTLPTFHPAYLLRTPASKRQSWIDLLAIDKRLRDLGLR
jgi:DNA polymerase